MWHNANKNHCNGSTTARTTTTARRTRERDAFASTTDRGGSGRASERASECERKRESDGRKTLMEGSEEGKWKLQKRGIFWMCLFSFVRVNSRNGCLGACHTHACAGRRGSPKRGDRRTKNKKSKILKNTFCKL